MQRELAEVEEARDADRRARCRTCPTPTRPTAMTEEDAVVLREVGEPPQFDFEPRDHLEIGTASA